MIVKRTDDEIRAYVDGYNAAFNQYNECLKGRKSLMDAKHKMQLFVDTVNNLINKEEHRHE